MCLSMLPKVYTKVDTLVKAGSCRIPFTRSHFGAMITHTQDNTGG